jgi:hypothetical protein
MEVKEDWLYSTDRLQLRSKCLNILMRRFGSHLTEDGAPEHSSESIYACAHDWVSQGHPTVNGIVAYYRAYYDNQLETRDGEVRY